jgi:hypothetical protein
LQYFTRNSFVSKILPGHPQIKLRQLIQSKDIISKVFLFSRSGFGATENRTAEEGFASGLKTDG